MKIREAMTRCSAVAIVAVAMLTGQGIAADQVPVTGPSTAAKICVNCHKPEATNLRGHWESIAMKSSSIQLKIDERSEVVRFDKSKLTVLNALEQGDLEKMLRSIKKGHEVRIEFAEKEGVKHASVVSAKPPIKLSAGEIITLPEVEKLVAQGPEKGKYFLFDSRPAPKYKEGAIPTAVSLPFPAFDKNAALLPADKNGLVIFYCSGATCNMSPGSQKKATALGYTNIKVFVEGMPAWLGKNYSVLPAKSLSEAYKDAAMVLLDARPVAQSAKGFIQGAVTFPVADAKALKLLPKKEVKAPVIVYDEDGKGNAAKVAAGIVKAGYTNVMVISDGFAGWKKAGQPVATGAAATTITYVPKPKPGEFPMEEFIKMVKAVPADVLVLDVRNKEEMKDGMIKGSVNIPAEEIETRYGELPKDKKIIAVCPTGTRAEMTYHTLKGKGFSNSYFLNAKVDYDDGQVEVSK